MSIALVVTGGFGNGTFLGTIPKVATRGFTISSDAVVIVTPACVSLLNSKANTIALSDSKANTVAMMDSEANTVSTSFLGC